MSIIQTRHITVKSGTVQFQVAVPLPRLYVTQAQADAVQERFPRIGKQVCVNGKGEFFGQEIVGTELPHLLEHVTIELLGQQTGHSFTGYTCWEEELQFTRAEGIALMNVNVSFEDDIQTLRAFKDACGILDEISD